MIPQPFLLAIPTLFAALTGWLRTVGLPRWANYGILFGFFAVAVFISVLVSGGLTGDPSKDFYIITGICAAIFAVLKPMIDKMTVAVPSPFSKYAAKRIAKLRAAREEAAAWKATTDPVPPRASAQPLPGRSIMPPGNVDGTGRSFPSQPGMGGSWNHPLTTKQFVGDFGTSTIADMPAMPKRPPTNPL